MKASPRLGVGNIEEKASPASGVRIRRKWSQSGRCSLRPHWFRNSSRLAALKTSRVQIIHQQAHPYDTGIHIRADLEREQVGTRAGAWGRDSSFPLGTVAGVVGSSIEA